MLKYVMLGYENFQSVIGKFLGMIHLDLMRSSTVKWISRRKSKLLILPYALLIILIINYRPEYRTEKGEKKN